MQNNKKKLPITTKSFRETVSSIPDIKNGYCSGLGALKNNAKHVDIADTKQLDGSVDIDKCTQELYPSDSRWDYVLEYDGKTYFVEVHPANTSNVKEVIKKAEWLSWWLDEKASSLKSKAADNVYWVATGKCKILPNSTHRKKLAQSKINMVGNVLKLPIR